MGYDAGSNPGASIPAPTPDAPDPNVTGANAGIRNLIDLINQYQGKYTDLAGQYEQIAQGVDPRFAALRDARLNLFRSNAGAQLNEVDTMFGRQGLEGSGAALNSRLKLLGGLGQQEQALSADLDMQQMNRQFEAMGQSLDPITAMLNLQAIPPALRAQLLAAQNAGEGGGSGGGGGTVICTMLYERGDLPPAIYRADREYGQRNVDDDTFRGYYAWARLLVTAASTRPWLYGVLRLLGTAWAEQMAWKMGVMARPNALGAALQALGQPLCKALGFALRGRHEGRRVAFPGASSSW